MTSELKRNQYVQLDRIDDLLQDAIQEYENKVIVLQNEFRDKVKSIIFDEDNPKFTCMECFETFDDLQEIIDHSKTQHPNSEVIK